MEMDFDVVVLGGSELGCGVLRELTLAGFKCILIEQDDIVMSESAKGGSSEVVEWDAMMMDPSVVQVRSVVGRVK
jgi:glycine/D-amino acid oxidase-like deaminating enzyme